MTSYWICLSVSDSFHSAKYSPSLSLAAVFTFTFSIPLYMFLFCFVFLVDPIKFSPYINFQFSSATQSRPTLCDPMNRSTPGLPVHYQLPESTQTHVHWVGDAIQPSHPLSSPSPPALDLSQHQGLFKWALCIRWPKDWSFSFSISPSNEHPGLISFRMDWLDLLAVQGTLKSLLQHHSSEASILWHSAFFMSNSHIHTWPLEKP